MYLLSRKNIKQLKSTRKILQSTGLSLHHVTLSRFSFFQIAHRILPFIEITTIILFLLGTLYIVFFFDGKGIDCLYP